MRSVPPSVRRRPEAPPGWRNGYGHHTVKTEAGPLALRDRYPSAMECREKDLEECLTYLLFPAEHRKRIRTTNLLERTFGESRRRTKVIPRFPGERACLTLVFAALLTASAKWRGVSMTPKMLRALDALRTEAPRARSRRPPNTR